MRLAELLLLSFCALDAAQKSKSYANPVSNPEISSKSIKAQQANTINLQQHQQQQQQQHQQQQKQQNDAHLNSLTAYATNYDNIASAHVQPQLTSSDISSSTSSVLSGIGGGSATTGNFKPSYKLPEMETNFTPIQSQTPSGSGATATLQTTPMLMQYLPAQALPDGTAGGVQYLQLIPTRPIIVPISPYLTAGGTPPTNSYASLAPTATTGNTLADYAATPMLNARHPAGHPMLNYATAAGLHAYANSIVPYARMNGVGIGFGGGGHHHFHRINRETKEKQFPPTLSLNLNEYLPGVQDAAHAASAALAYMRGRP